MAIKIINTRDYSMNGVKVLVSSLAGMGKTVLSSTAPAPIIISAEAGLLSLAEVDVPAIEVSTVDDVMDTYQFLTESNEAKQFETLCLDSISEIAEVLLTQYKKDNKDPRAAYGQMNDDMSSLIRAFRDIKGKHVYFTAKEAKIVDDDIGITTFKASMPGKTMLNALPFFFDEVFTLRLGKLEDETVFRYLQTAKDLRYIDCKDRSGKMGPMEKPDLTYIFDKISGKIVDDVEEEDPDETAKQEAQDEEQAKDEAADQPEKTETEE